MKEHRHDADRQQPSANLNAQCAEVKPRIAHLYPLNADLKTQTSAQKRRDAGMNRRKGKRKPQKAGMSRRIAKMNSRMATLESLLRSGKPLNVTGTLCIILGHSSAGWKRRIRNFLRSQKSRRKLPEISGARDADALERISGSEPSAAILQKHD